MTGRRVWWSVLALVVVGIVVLPLLGGLGGASGQPVRSALVGRAAPALAGPTLDGGSFDLGALRGQVVLVNVWASWCGPCRDELPLIAKTEQRLAPAGLRVVTIDTRDGPVAARSLLAETGATGLTTVLDPDGRLAVSWGAHGVPETFLLDPSGTIQAFHPGPINQEWVRSHVDPLVDAS
ncbi:TlpA disulfide reductase family protein [Pseudonocardia sp. MH-G8]|uniref:TlpA family protein disulfide reductase n=1 Tax=Pseudonocardia sp. MH-G8 TaxID=1854588 RepID=UPI000BD5FCD7|nr:TlpA disulfide reductase family protein [Pseudonocardia sp. MH-G8]OZM77206.1 hypothetical protein CFP66_36895 [Pseudonocardia sp. MH-G8]